MDNVANARAFNELVPATNELDAPRPHSGFAPKYKPKNPVIPSVHKIEKLNEAMKRLNHENSSIENQLPPQPMIPPPLRPKPRDDVIELEPDEDIEPKKLAPKTKPMTLFDWINFTKPVHLTAGDIKNLRKGDVIVALCLDEHMQQAVLNDYVNRRNVVIAPHIFFRCCHWIIYTHEKNFQGKATFYHENLSTGKVDYFNLDIPFEFHVEYEPDQWFPLTRGVLDRRAFLQDHSEFPEEFELRRSTRVGLRGPMLVSQVLEKCPSLYRK